MHLALLRKVVVAALSLVAAAGSSWARAGAQSVTLQIKPRVGDTLRMRLDQESELTGVRRRSDGESGTMVLTSMRMFSRAIVEGASDQRDGEGGGTTVLAVTDSVLLSTTDEHVRAAAVQIQEQMRGQRIRFRVAPDGTVEMMHSPGGTPREVVQVVSLMPAAFPKGPISVGESWIREMPLPAGTQLGAQVSGKLHVTFRLDSLTHGREWAYVSMRGEMRPATGPGASASVLDKGLVNGTMLVDQRRGWLIESRFNIVVSSTVTPPSSMMAGGITSMHMQMRITQHMHTFERR